MTWKSGDVHQLQCGICISQSCALWENCAPFRRASCVSFLGQIPPHLFRCYLWQWPMPIKASRFYYIALGFYFYFDFLTVVLLLFLLLNLI